MASLLFHLTLCLAAAAFVAGDFSDDVADILSTSDIDGCSATRFPDTCHATLSAAELPRSADPINLITATCAASRSGVSSAITMVQSILDSAGANQPNMTTAAKDCLELLSFSDRRLALASDSSTLASGRVKDARAWLSAALLYQYDCFSALKYVNTTVNVNSTMSFLLDLQQQTSNALALTTAYGRFGPNTAMWSPPQTERDGHWDDEDRGGGGGGGGGGFSPSPSPTPLPTPKSEPEPEPAPGPASEAGSPWLRHGGGEFPTVDDADVTVCEKDCDFQSVQAAVDEAPENLAGGRRFVIFIKVGMYNETVRVGVEKTNLVFLGEGTGRTIIRSNLSVAQMVGVTTYSSATVDKNYSFI